VAEWLDSVYDDLESDNLKGVHDFLIFRQSGLAPLKLRDPKDNACGEESERDQGAIVHGR